MHGAPVAEYVAATWKPTRARISYITSQERHCLAAADHVVVVSHAMQEYFWNTHTLTKAQFTVLPCVTNMRRFDPRLRSQVRSRYGLDGRLVFAYLGSYVHYQRVGDTIDLFVRLQDADPRALLLILTDHRKEFEKSLRGKGVTSDRYSIMSVPHEEVFSVLPAADVGFLLRDWSLVNQVASPTKFAEYLVCGVPVVISPGVGDYSRVVGEERLGFCLEDTDDLRGLRRFLREVVDGREEYAYRCNRYACEHLSWESVGGSLLRHHEAVLGKPRTGGGRG